MESKTKSHSLGTKINIIWIKNLWIPYIFFWFYCFFVFLFDIGTMFYSYSLRTKKVRWVRSIICDSCFPCPIYISQCMIRIKSNKGKMYAQVQYVFKNHINPFHYPFPFCSSNKGSSTRAPVTHRLTQDSFPCSHAWFESLAQGRDENRAKSTSSERIIQLQKAAQLLDIGLGRR